MKKLNYVMACAAMALAFLVFAPGAKAQLHVEASGEVGIGTTTPNSKLHVVNTTSIYSAQFRNQNNTNSSKYGLYNYIDSQGTGFRIGQYNLTYGNSTSTSSAYGIYNYLNSYGYGVGMYSYLYQGSSATSNGRNIYAYTNSYSSSAAYGLYSYVYSSSSTSADRYGVYSQMSANGSGTHYGVYSTVNGTGNYAGYFIGDVYVQGAFTQTSDERKKKNIEPLRNALDIVTQLEGKTYEFEAEGDEYLPEGKQFGFLAQDLEKIIPEVVKEVDVPGEQIATDKNGEEVQPLTEEQAQNGEFVEAPDFKTGEGSSLKSVNYTAIIPILVEAIKEQQKEIEALKQQLKK